MIVIISRVNGFFLGVKINKICKYMLIVRRKIKVRLKVDLIIVKFCLIIERGSICVLVDG